MGLTLDTPEATGPHKPAEPVELPELAAEVFKLGAIAARLETTLGNGLDGGKPTGLCALVAELRDTVGSAPNAATGDPGDGLCAVVANLAMSHATQSRRVVTGATLAAGGAMGVIEGVLQLVKLLHG